jgi:aromatic-L-amino-acid/L-tryptophan decarboxylase
MIEDIKALEASTQILDPTKSKRDEWDGLIMNYSHRFLDQLEESNALFNTEKLGAGILDFNVEENPTDLDTLLEAFKLHVEEGGINGASPGHMGYIPGGGLYPSALADYLAAVTNKYAGVFYPAPGAVRIENMLIGWMNELMGFPKTAAGNLTSGGSISNLIAVVTAREAMNVKAKDFHRLVVYLSDQTHHSLQKALKIAGLGEAQLRYLPVDEDFRIHSKDLLDAITIDEENGLLPFFVNASLGTTNTGTIDPINEMADIANSHKVWFHVDAAYGGFFKLISEINEKCRGVEKADSIILDPHKSLFLPSGSGAVLIKDVKSLYKAHQYTADYLQDIAAPQEEISPADVSPELTKHFRALRMWLPLKLFGLSPFRDSLKEKMLLAQYFHQEIQKIAGFKVGPSPDLSVAIFRYVPESGDANLFNEKLIKSIQADGRIFLSSTTIGGVFWIRVAILIFRTHLSHIDLLLQIVNEKVDELSD